MKRLLTLLLLLPVVAFSQEPPEMVQFMEVTVKHGHQRQFYEGMQKYKKCHAENNSDAQWSAWWRMQGEGTTVVFTSDVDNYAQLDEDMTDADRKCRSIVESDLYPNTSNLVISYNRPMRDWSVDSPPDGSVVEVTFFEVENPWEFRETISEIVETAKTSDLYKAHWLESTGGEGYDLMVARFYEKFADMDKDEFNPWKIYAEKHGQDKLKAIQTRLNKSVKNVTEYMYRLDRDISYMPSDTTN